MVGLEVFWVTVGGGGGIEDLPEDDPLSTS